MVFRKITSSSVEHLQHTVYAYAYTLSISKMTKCYRNKFEIVCEQLSELRSIFFSVSPMRRECFSTYMNNKMEIVVIFTLFLGESISLKYDFAFQ